VGCSRLCPKMMGVPCFWFLLWLLVGIKHTLAQTYAQVVPNTGILTSMVASASSERTSPYQPASALLSGGGWNSGTFPEGWWQVDLGQVVNLYSITLITSQDPPGNTVHTIYTGTGALSPLYTFSAYTYDSQTLSTPVYPVGTLVRYIRIVTPSSPSWVAWNSVVVNIYYQCIFYGIPSIVLSTNNAQKCAGTNTGTASVIGSGGSGSYTYYVDSAAKLSNSFTGLATGNHTAYLLDTTGCQSASSVSWTTGSAIALNATVTTEPSCFGGSNGVVSLSAYGGTGTYKYTLNSATQTVSTFNGLAANTYSFSISDTNDCEITRNATVASLPDVVVSPVVVNQQCAGTATGSVVLNAVGGINYGFVYSVNGSSFDASSNFTNLYPGLYAYKVVDNYTCAGYVNVTVTPVSEIKVNVTPQAQLCAFNNSGVITLDVSGGAGNYQYSVDGGLSYFATNQFTGLAPGEYNWSVKDKNNCLKNGKVEVISVSVVNATYTSTPILCNGENSSISIFAEGGVGDYSYSLDGAAYVKENSFSLLAGNYKFNVQDANQCTFSFNVVLTQNPVLEVSASSLPSCFEKSNGQIVITASGGAGGYQYMVDSATQTANIFTDMYGGNFTYSVTDANQCVASSSVPVELLPALEVNKTVLRQLCAGTATGSVVFSVIGGNNAGFEFSQNGTGFVQSGTFQDLNPGVYEYTIRDNYTCTISVDVLIPSISDIVVEVTPTAQLCAFNSSGMISFSVNGGAENYSYSIDNGDTYYDSNTFTGLLPATYQWIIRDANGCEKSGSVDVASMSAVNGICNISSPIKCYGDTGAITIHAQGGTGTYTYSLDGITFVTSNVFGDLVAGDYKYFIKDTNQCVFISSAKLEQNLRNVV